jgi:hypothetical protein
MLIVQYVEYGLEWTGVDWSGLDWTGVDWSALDWSGVDWSGLDWTASVCLEYKKRKGWHFDLELFRASKLTGALGSGRCRASELVTAIRGSLLEGVSTSRG